MEDANETTARYRTLWLRLTTAAAVTVVWALTGWSVLALTSAALVAAVVSVLLRLLGVAVPS